MKSHKALLLTLLVASLSPMAASAQAPPAQPNVLVIVIDDASWNEFTPDLTTNIAALADNGRVYTQFYTSTTCSPTRYQLMFGRYPHRALIGSAVNDRHPRGVEPSELSLPEVLQASGYATGLFGKWHVNWTEPAMVLKESARIHGFQDWRAGRVANLEPESHAAFGWDRIDNGFATTATEYSSEAIVNAWQDWWQLRNGEPKFAVMSFLAPHYPFTVPPPGLLCGYTPPSNQPVDRYHAALKGIDCLLADVLADIDEQDTYVFLLSDNGTPFNKLNLASYGPYQGYKLTQFQGGINVPLIARGPSILPGLDASLVQACDLPGTILELCGSTPATGFDDSQPFTCTFDGLQAGPRQIVFSQRFQLFKTLPPVGQWPVENNDWAILRADGFKYIHREYGNPPSSSSDLLYNVFVDPWETTPLDTLDIKDELRAIYCELVSDDWPFSLGDPSCP